MPERRRSQRTNLHQIVYVDMGPDNGGIVLNVSEGGIAFCSAVPIRPTEVIQFSLLVTGKGRMDGAGGVAWTSGKMCGLRLDPDSADGSERLSCWAAPACATTLAASPAPVAPSEDSTAVLAVNEYVSPLPRPSDPPSASPTPVSASVERGPFDPLAAEDLVAIPPGLQFAPAIVLRAIVLALLVAALVAVAYFTGTRPEKPPVEASDYSGAISNPQPKAATVRPAEQEAGLAELVAALRYLRAPSGQRDTTSATRLLQLSVKGGNSSAGIFLADMYVSGEGVRKNCTDARALLTAAAKKGNIEASVKLKELFVKGCR